MPASVQRPRRQPVVSEFNAEQGILWLGREGKPLEGYYLDRLEDGVLLTCICDRSRCHRLTVGAGLLCSCPDATYRPQCGPCKHVVAVQPLIENGAV